VKEAIFITPEWARKGELQTTQALPMVMAEKGCAPDQRWLELWPRPERPSE
jgi:hypothetical protein